MAPGTEGTDGKTEGPKVTFSRQEKDQQAEGGEENAGGDDVDDVEQRLPLDDEEEHHLLVLQVVLCVQGVDELLGRSVFDHPLSVLWQHIVNPLVKLILMMLWMDNIYYIVCCCTCKGLWVDIHPF